MIEWWGPIIHEYYSGTEGMGMTWITSAEALTHPGSVGKAIWGEAHVCGDDGEELPPGQDGVVYFGGRAGVTFEYNNDPEKTKESFHEKGWGTLWDVGHLDEEGYLYLTDRKTVHDRLRRRQHLPAGDRERPGHAPGRRRRRRVRRPRARDGRGGQGRRPARPRVHRRARTRRGDPGLQSGEPVALQVPQVGRLHRRLPRGENGKLYKKPLREAYWASSTPSAT